MNLIGGMDMEEIRRLEDAIEQERVQLYGMAAAYGFRDNRTIQQSQRLDDILNSYEALVKGKEPTA
ncbi:hypothetical protein CDO73_26255 [Saccharibacillus sp. O23]|nr:hypothetical protein CDO73_26255 [Saccharibacillus sp. O23]